MQTAHENPSAVSLDMRADERAALATNWAPRTHEPVLVSLDPRRQVWHRARTLDSGVLTPDNTRTYKVQWMGPAGWRVQSGFSPAADNMLPSEENL